MTNENRITKGKFKRLPLCALALLLLLSLLATPALAYASEDVAFTSSIEARGIGDTSTQRAQVGNVSYDGGKVSYTLPGMPSRGMWDHRRLNVTVNGRTLPEVALVMNGTTYLPLRAFLSVLGNAKVSYNSSTKTATASINGLYISVSDGGFVTYANDRPLFSFSPAVLMNNGKMYVPASALLKATGLRLSSQSTTSLICTGSFSPLVHASRFYREDEVLWLSRIISAESRGEPLIGQIAVGNVIMNRVRSPLFPNTIWSVIFDRRYGVQFSPVANGTIYQNAAYTSVLAAKICLEGTSLSNDTLYFLAPSAASSNWIVNNREYAYTILNHDFYK